MAAVDIRRAGYISAIPNELIDDVHHHYLGSKAASGFIPSRLLKHGPGRADKRLYVQALAPTEGDFGPVEALA